jgi:hypothetical protein
MAKQTLPPFFVGTAQFLTFYKMYGRYFVRMKSSLTAERVKTDDCFAATRWQASIMAQASRIGSAAYALIPPFSREYRYYRILTGKANLLLKKGLHEDEIIMRLIDKYVVPLKKQALRENRRKLNREKKKRTRNTRPPYLRHHRRLRMVESEPLPATVSLPRMSMDAVDDLLNMIQEKYKPELSPPLAA